MSINTKKLGAKHADVILDAAGVVANRVALTAAIGAKIGVEALGNVLDYAAGFFGRKTNAPAPGVAHPNV
ncbi:MAG: hypothetical protein NT123_20900 [Proteobacteria bacterium]|nr:hypothetical protein [Pseudomonadota bacterium]